MSNGTSPLWRVLFLAEHYGRMILTLDEVADQIGLAPGTIRNRRTRGEFQWLRNDGRTLTADAQDVADYVERLRRGAAAEAVASNPTLRKRRSVR